MIGTAWHCVALRGTEWHGVARSGTEWYGVALMAYLLAHLIGAPLPRRVGAGADVAVGQNAGVSDGVKRMSFEQVSPK